MVEQGQELAVERLEGFCVGLSRGETQSEYLFLYVLQLLAQDLEAILYDFFEVRPEGKAFLLFEFLQEILGQ